MFAEIERSLVAKAAGPGADVIVVAGSWAAVIDGATVAEPCECCGSDAGRLAAERLAALIAELGPDTSLPGFLLAAEQSLRAATADRPCRGRAWSASAVVYAARHGQVWLIGDAAAIVGGVHHRLTKQIDDAAARFRSVVDRAALSAGATVDELRADDPGRQAIRALLTRQWALRNNPGAGELAYPAIAPEPIPPELCRIVPVEVPDTGVDLILASDGYPDLRPTLAESEAALAGRLAQDPLLIAEVPETKGLGPGASSFDDRAYLRLRLHR
ncbi:hypothetical protein [Gordonia sp. VNK21]|uniref:hypothetical protein n=1 Tax=Gordonia sp. VNK21 TaxID=3382483 RepID=UPI0038D3EB93